MPSGAGRTGLGMALAEQPLRTTEFLAVDVETNGGAGEACELTEVGAVLVGGGELHDAGTCARVFCALFGRLCANAATVGEAVALLSARRRRRRRLGPPPGRLAGDGAVPRGLDLSTLPNAPGVYVFRDGGGRPL